MSPSEALKILDGAEVMVLNRSYYLFQEAITMAMEALVTVANIQTAEEDTEYD